MKKKFNDFEKVDFDKKNNKKKNYLSKRKKVSDREFYDDALDEYDDYCEEELLSSYNGLGEGPFDN